MCTYAQENFVSKIYIKASTNYSNVISVIWYYKQPWKNTIDHIGNPADDINAHVSNIITPL